MYKIGKEIYRDIASLYEANNDINNALKAIPVGHSLEVLKKEKARVVAEIEKLEKETWVDRDTYNGLKRRLQMMSGLPAELINDIVNGPDPGFGFESQILPSEGYKNKA